MTISDYSIENPVFAWCLMTALIVFGIIGFSRMGVSQMPDVDFPVLTVTATWEGTDPMTMESAVTDVLENQFMTIPGLELVQSTTQEGQSNITLQFTLGTDINGAMVQVQNAISAAQRYLPPIGEGGMDPPVIAQFNANSQPILWTALMEPSAKNVDFYSTYKAGPVLRPLMLTLRDHYQDYITSLPGVGSVFLGGYILPVMRLWIHTNKLRKIEMTPMDVMDAVNKEHMLAPSGYMDNGPVESNVRAITEANTVDEMRNLVMPTRNGVPVWRPLKLKDVADVEEGTDDIRRISRMDGIPSVGVGVLKSPGANAVEVGHEVKKKVKELAHRLPNGITVKIVTDTTIFIEQAVHQLLRTLTESCVTTSVVCLLFLASFASAFNILLAIPTALLGTFIVLYFLGFTINSFTMLALSLSVGIVVDDAIMVLENIVRHIDDGMGRVQASIVGAREITGAAVAASLAIFAVFVPVVFMQGIIGRFFYQFGVTMSVAVLFSLLEALTLTPMRCSQFLTPKSSTSKIDNAIESVIGYLRDIYRKSLQKTLKHPYWMIASAWIVFGLSFIALKGVRKEFIPPQDQSRFMVQIQTPIGSSMEFTDKVIKKVENFLKNRPEIKDYYAAIGGFQGGLVNQGMMFVTMKDPPVRPLAPPFKKVPTQQQFQPFLRKFIHKLPGVWTVSILDLSLTGFSAQRGYPIEFAVQGPDWGKIADLSDALMKKMSSSGLMTSITSDYEPGMPEIRVVPNRAKAAAHGVNVADIAQTLNAAVGGLRFAKYTDAEGHRDDIQIKLVDQDNDVPADIGKLWIRNNQGEIVPLKKVVDIIKDKTLLQVTRYNRERAVTIFANIKQGKSAADAIDFIKKTAKKMLPPGYHIMLSGNMKAFKESFQSLIVALILGLFAAYMILGTQFRSFIHPMVIMISLPSAVAGSFFAMRIAGVSLNIYSLIGLILVLGIVKKNTILIVDFTNQRRRQGKGVIDALLDAGPVRLRPILMTSLATLAGAAPAVFASGAGEETIRPMGVVVFGGVLVSTLMSLYVCPSWYLVLSRFESHKHDDELKDAMRLLGELPAEKAAA